MLTTSMINYLANNAHIETKEELINRIADYYQVMLLKLYKQFKKISSVEEEV